MEVQSIEIEVESQKLIDSKNNISESEEGGVFKELSEHLVCDALENKLLFENYFNQLPNQIINNSTPVPSESLIQLREDRSNNIEVCGRTVENITAFKHDYEQEFVSNNIELDSRNNDETHNERILTTRAISSQSDEEDSVINPSSITVPPALKRKGKPKDSELTAIDTKKIEKKPFAKLPKSERINYLLSWLIKNVRLEYVKKELTEEDLLNIDAIDKRISKNCCKKVFFCLLLETYCNKKRKWMCSIYRESLNNEPGIRCDRCLNWFHVNNCMKTFSSLHNQYWMCEPCHIHYPFNFLCNLVVFLSYKYVIEDKFFLLFCAIPVDIYSHILYT